MRNSKIDEPKKTIACWSDLLGFGAQLSSLNWDITKDQDSKLSTRLLGQLSIINERSSYMEKASIINDAIIRTLNAEYYSGEKPVGFISQWIDQCISSHCNIMTFERSFGFPGIRTIICEGQTLSYEPLLESHSRNAFGMDNVITALFNTALSKCYIADQFGSKIGLKKGSIYIEETILNQLTSIFGCRILDGLLFPYSHPILSPVSKYFSIPELFFIKEFPGEFDFEDAFIRHCWLKLGQRIDVEHKDLAFCLVEIEAYSPREETSLFWYDTLKGTPHGISMNHSTYYDIPKKKAKYVSTKSKENELLAELLSIGKTS